MTPLLAIPHTADELVDMLDKAFPLRNFPPDAPLHVIQRECGKRDVIDLLRELQRERDDRTEERVFNPPTLR